MKKLFISILSFAALLTTTVSCDDQLEDINKNPNAPEITQVPAFGVFNSASAFVMTESRGSFSSGRMALPWVQYSAQRNYTEEDRFQFREVTNQALYLNYYLAAQDFKTVIDLNTNPTTKIANEAYGNNTNQIAAARVMLAYTFLQLVDAYGDVPYYSYGNADPDFQALQIDKGILKPKFASQQKIYTDLMKELKEAAESVVTSETVVFTKGDRLFGTPAKLVKFANSLRLRIATRVKGVVPGAEAHITDAIASGVMTSNADNVGVKYQNDLINPSPFYRDFYISNRTDFAISNTLVDLLKGNTGVFGLDPRLQKYAAPITATKTAVRDNTYAETDDLSQYRGMPYGITSAQAAGQRTNTSFWSNSVLRRDYTEILMEYAEVAFLVSESKGWSAAEYQAGVRASMERWGVATAKINAYVAALPAPNQANVITQKYLALFMQPYEAYAEYRRTGYPNTLLQPGGTYTFNNPVDGVTTYTFTALNNLTAMPARFTYPVNLQTLNGENVAAAAAAIGGDQLDTKLIWAK
ncbi:SusD/RagB family nutrient-binding outer membrane lipoprotein [Flavobacterium sp. GA093]|uniref:SusD/RagB family nutrient-binding outer membrane lipoprotein n=1 Tax=Flavobacterium hydrocarbonoxydans TaxID=2683249 RepID=A0A6I4NRX3_9FLAO|nr:SusD/RagB family nutrient-binding outer membrane lipoprotein [Flavobacterium hydrocarbonoxydans]MWB94429.1 SusD/RagB family nutrient-binding outer membrane lipoprotein [Flavobacterium hydrocarbonoxydans]